MTVALPETVTRVLDHPEIHTQITTDAPAGQCTWCQMDGVVCAASITWTPRPDVMSNGAAESCLTCLHLPLRWALDDAATDSIVIVELAGGAPDRTSAPTESADDICGRAVIASTASVDTSVFPNVTSLVMWSRPTDAWRHGRTCARDQSKNDSEISARCTRETVMSNDH